MRGLERLAERVWYSEDLPARALRAALVPASLAYGAALRLRAAAYRLRLRRRWRLPAAVVSVGNLVVGGTGKTPTALWLSERLRERGRQVAILSRGHGGSEPGPLLVGPGPYPPGVPGTGDWRQVGDETVLLARRFAGPVIVARRRVEAGRLACSAFGVDTLVLDDGFQHLALKRDFDLVCFRAGSGRRVACLPAGPFREPLAALGRAHAVVFTKGEGAALDPALAARLRGRPVFRGELRAVGLVTAEGGRWRELPLGRLAGQRVLVVSGVADRESFYRTVREWEAQPVDFLEFPDHHPYSLEDWKAIALRARDLDLVVTTEKDLVKLADFPFAREKLMAVRVAMEIEEGDRLVDLVLEALAESSGGRSP